MLVERVVLQKNNRELNVIWCICIQTSDLNKQTHVPLTTLDANSWVGSLLVPAGISGDYHLCHNSYPVCLALLLRNQGDATSYSQWYGVNVA